MIDVPTPSVLDPERPQLDSNPDVPAVDRLAQARQLDGALTAATDYGHQLWTELDGLRRYLLDSAPVAGAATDADRLLTAPRGPGDDAGWQEWQRAYASATSVLAGPAGDSGFGEQEATQEAQTRRGTRPAPVSEQTLTALTEPTAPAPAAAHRAVDTPAAAPAAPAAAAAPAAPALADRSRLALGSAAAGLLAGLVLRGRFARRY